MDSELERYHKSCAALELNVGEGRSKHAALQKELARQRAQTQEAQQSIRYTPSSPTVVLLFFAMHQAHQAIRYTSSSPTVVLQNPLSCAALLHITQLIVSMLRMLHQAGRNTPSSPTVVLLFFTMHRLRQHAQFQDAYQAVKIHTVFTLLLCCSSLLRKQVGST